MLLYPSTPQSIGMLVWIDTTYRQTNSTVRCLSVCLAVSTAALTIHVIRFMKKMRKNRLKWSYLDQELISYSNSSCRSCCCWGYRFQNRIEKKFGKNAPHVNSLRIDWRSRIFYLTSHFQDDGHDVILRKKSADTWWVNTKRLPGAYAVYSDFFVYRRLSSRLRPTYLLTDDSSWSIIYSYLFLQFMQQTHGYIGRKGATTCEWMRGPILPNCFMRKSPLHSLSNALISCHIPTIAPPM